MAFLADQYLLVESRALCCAIPLAAVSEIMRPLPLQAVTPCPQGVLGMAVIRGNAVPVVGLADISTGESVSPYRFVSLKSDPCRCALAVERVTGIRTLPKSSVQSLPPLMSRLKFAQEVVALDKQLAIILDTARIVPVAGECV